MHAWLAKIQELKETAIHDLPEKKYNGKYKLVQCWTKYIVVNISETGLCSCPQVRSLPSWAQQIRLNPISRHQNQHKAGYINQTQH
jgi:hypothetical protein